MPNPTPSRRPPTPEQIIAQQRRDAANEKQRRDAEHRKQTEATQAARQNIETGKQLATKSATAPAVPDSRSAVAQYIDEVAPATFPGRLVKFSKEGRFVTSDDGEAIAEDRDFVALCDETLVGWIKFSGEEGVPPERHQGILYDNYVMPTRESLGDTDPAQWPVGLSGAPEDPWQHQQVLVLQDREAGELFSFATSSRTGRRAVGNLLRTYERLKRQHPDTYPVVHLKAGGFNHRDERIGWVSTPSFVVVGRAPKNSAAVPDTSPAADMSDEIPF